MPMPYRRALAAGSVAAAAALSSLVSAPGAVAATGDPHLVISEVYGGGGNTGSTWTNDFVELYNPTAAAIDVSTMSVQYRSSSGTVQVTTLSGSVPANGHYLVQEAAGSGGTTPLPKADAVGTVSMAGNGGTVYLAEQRIALSVGPGSVVGSPGVVDLVGYGSTTFETATAPSLSSTTSDSRAAAGTDSDDNSKDFTAGAPSPEASGTDGGGGDPGDPPTPESQPIAEIQGTTDTSPYVGKTVVTDGVVTASYPTGGFKGFYLQTPGTGGDLLANHTASDAVFVYLGSQTAYPAIGDHVTVTGAVSEFAGLTEVSPAVGGVVSNAEPAAAVKPVTNAWPATNAGREAVEGMLVQPGAFTVTDVYTLNNFGEIDLASGDEPLVQPTDVARPGTPAYDAVVADNAARGVVLDDGSSTNYLTTGKDTPLPWITKDRPVRVGAKATFTQPVVVDYRNDEWKLQPTSQLTAAGPAPATFPNTRTAAPQPVAGALKIASFNVLNFFTETGEDYVASGGTCTSYADRAGHPVTVNDCGPNGPRGAWDDADEQRQQDKIVHAINAFGADVLSLEEIANSVKFGDDRDAALAHLVDALNADAGSAVWAYVPSPPASELPPVADQDVIRTAFIYKLAKAEPVGASHVLVGSAAFANAREPLGQVFKPKGGATAQEFLAVVNHFKSKSSGDGQDADQGDGQGGSNFSRVQQAHALVDFVDGLRTSTGVSKVFLTGDFNSYTEEDPVQVLRDAGYTDVGSTKAPGESTYVFDGLVGSLDHVLVNDAALPTVQGAHVWNINSVESVAYEYSRFNYNATDFYDPGPYRSSDHDPTLVGFTIADPRPAAKVRAIAVPTNPRAGSYVLVGAQVTANGRTVKDGVVEVRDGDTLLGKATVHQGYVAVPFRIATKGTRTLTVSYAGTETTGPGSTTVTVRVR